jgi:hypothetical protein
LPPTPVNFFFDFNRSVTVTTSDLLTDAADWLNLLFIHSTASGEDYIKHICPLINQLRRRADDLRIFTK